MRTESSSELSLSFPGPVSEQPLFLFLPGDPVGVGEFIPDRPNTRFKIVHSVQHANGKRAACLVQEREVAHDSNLVRVDHVRIQGLRLVHNVLNAFQVRQVIFVVFDFHGFGAFALAFHPRGCRGCRWSLCCPLFFLVLLFESSYSELQRSEKDFLQLGSLLLFSVGVQGVEEGKQEGASQSTH